MTAGEQFRALCTDKMAEGMDRIVGLGGGEITERDVRSYAVVITVRKKKTEG